MTDKSGFCGMEWNLCHVIAIIMLNSCNNTLKIINIIKYHMPTWSISSVNSYFPCNLQNQVTFHTYTNFWNSVHLYKLKNPLECGTLYMLLYHSSRYITLTPTFRYYSFLPLGLKVGI